MYASYGMTETASQIANTLITPSFSGGLKLLSGYTARIVDPDEQGFGRLAVRGPSVFEGYLNARAAFTVDGYFLTGDTAALYDGAIFIRERTADMFVSGGENVYPAEIAAALRQVPGVADAYVFGIPDSTWGRRPVAVVERGEQTQSGGAQVTNAQLTPQSLREALAPRLSKVYMPQQFCVVDELPRLGIGKVDRAAVEAQYEQRLQVERIVLYHVRLPFKNPFRTARGTLHDRDSLIVEVIDHAGRRGLGECVAFPTDWYLPETLGQDVRVIRGLLAPLLLETAFLHPREASRLFGESPEALVHPMACAALEMALWDLYGQVVRKPLWKLLDEEYRRLGGKALAGATAATAGATGTAGAAAMGSPSSTGGLGGRLRVPAGAVVGIGSPNQTVEAVRGCVEAGYRRVKLKISPVQGLECVRAVREVFPKLVITLDANQSFPPHRVEDLRAYDDLGVSWIEEPFDLSGRDGGRVSAKKAFLRLSSLQRMLKTPICVDESFVDAAGAYEMLLFPELRCVALKLGKMGGIQPALEYLCKAQEMGCAVWMGGMYDTGISKRAHAAFQTLPGIDVPGDIGATARYFNVDVTRPVYGVERGCVALNERGHEFGLGCSLDVQALAKVLVNRLVIDRP